MKRLKPTGKEFDDFVDEWYRRGHDGKIYLAESHGVKYNTARHWVCDEGVSRKEKEAPRMTVTVPELMGMKTFVNLDFVFFDLETSNLNADFSVMLAACIKPYGQPTMVFRADDYPEWTTNRANDYQITRDIATELRKHAIVVGHYSSKFDMPFLRAKMTKHGLEPLPPMFGIDTWRIAKTNFKVSSRRLKNLASYFEVGNKDGVEGALWMDAAYNGSKEAMDKIVEHNIVDVEVLERLTCISFPYLKAIPKL
uniref:Putative RNase_H superfamily protein n=1 Tax=viral metagenome TaxID=1070528 RepID=A0A6M3KW26_9ZZZZ